MECGSVVLASLTIYLLMAGKANWCNADPTGNVPALFVFGDSLLDTGNNNGLATLARAASPPYENDFPDGGGAGRFSNGPITTDFLAAFLNLTCPPPYVSAGDNIEHGVNFASAGSGILETTGGYYGQHYSMGTQVTNFENVKNRLVQKVGEDRAALIISKAIFYITVGSNDYLATYYAVPPDTIYSSYSPARFRQLLISILSYQLQRLYDLGARKFAVTSIPNIGCAPYALRLFNLSAKDQAQCVAFMNDAAQLYNIEFYRLIRRLQYQNPDARFISNNAFASATYVYTNYAKYGLVNVKDACCNLGEFVQSFCVQGFNLCSNASTYYFFDGFHPTSPVHKATVDNYITGSSSFVFPINIQTLASLP